MNKITLDDLLWEESKSPTGRYHSFYKNISLALGGVRDAGPWGGGATAIAVNPSNPRMLLAGGRNSLVYRSTDGGDTWTRLAFPRHFLGAVTSLLFDANDAKHYLVGIDNNGSPFSGLWITHDEGRTWTEQADLAGTPRSCR